MKVEIEVNQWWEVHYVEEVEEYNQRENYTRKQPGLKVFINEGESLDFVVKLKKDVTYSHIVVKHCKEIQK